MTVSLDQLRSLSTGAVTDAPCPICGPECKTEANRRRKVLRIWDNGGFYTFKCARCEIKGWGRDDVRVRPAPKPKPPEPDKADLARYLWSKSLPLRGTLAEHYLRSRGCFIASDTLRFLPAGKHLPAMIARFGRGELTGVHLTKLSKDGHKAGTDADKIIIGPSMGQPIVLNDNPEREELVVAEGIEDTASLAITTGWSAWAAGTANRIAPVIAAAKQFPKIYCAVDLDWGKRHRAGPRALEQSRIVRPDLIALRIEKAMGLTTKLDANKALLTYGPQVLLAIIDWCEAQEQFTRGQIGFHAMQNAVSRLNRLFAAASE